MSIVATGRSYRKEAVVAVAAVGIAIIVWNFRDRIASFWNSLGFSCSSSCSTSEKSSGKSTLETTSPVVKSADVAPESVNEKEKTSAEKLESPVAPPEPSTGNIAPESTEKPTSSVYVGLPKADPTNVSASIHPPNWPGATPR
ncbi:hypothetical protein CAEBREN_25430 [Caenorhabditis brenneri]|uniref:Uncharacterized protein n=1 Tax=Caenorhabditis brenneri TaxID=135651 RepID=G0PF91_CAEBE|nr:hypothetical protein CAEBREN_25430 [Caenorhabditis brenneri]